MNNVNVTVLKDEALSAAGRVVEREYNEVKRKACVGELVKVFGHCHPEANGVFTVDSVHGDVICYAVDDDPNWGTPYGNGKNYVTLEPSDTVHINSERFRMVDRKAAVGERVIMTAATGTRLESGRSAPDYYNGDIFVIERANAILATSTVGKLFYHREYRVLEPLNTPLSSRPAAEQSAEIIAELTLEVTRLKDAMRRMNTDLRVAREDIVLIEEGVSGDIRSLEKRVTALEVADSPTVIRTKPTLAAAPKTPQQIRDEIVERAKADVEALTDGGGHVKLPNNFGSNFTCIPEYIVNREKRKVTVILRGWNSGKVRAVGHAICAPNDVFNAHIGKAIALRRALGLEVPAEYLSVPNPTEVSVGDYVEIIGNGSEGIRHYYDIGDIGIVTSVGVYVTVTGVRTRGASRSSFEYVQGVAKADVRVIDYEEVAA